MLRLVLAGVAVMALARMKTRIILAQYLELQRAMQQRQGFDFGLSGLRFLKLGLYLVSLVL